MKAIEALFKELHKALDERKKEIIDEAIKANEKHSVIIQAIKADLLGRLKSLEKTKTEAMEALTFDAFNASVSSPAPAPRAEEKTRAQIDDVSSFLGDACDTLCAEDISLGKTPFGENRFSAKNEERFASFKEYLLTHVVLTLSPPPKLTPPRKAKKQQSPVDFAWDETKKDSNIAIAADGATATTVSKIKQWQTVLSKAVLSSGKWSFDLKFNNCDSSGNVFVGVAAEGFSMFNQYLGSDALSWGYFGYDGNKYTRGRDGFGSRMSIEF